MKRFKYIFFFAIFSFISCEEVVDVKVPSGEPKLVIDAFIEVFFNELPIVADTKIKLSLSADFFKEGNPIVTNANVFLTNLSDSSIINYADTDLDGVYEPTILFIPEDNSIYELTVEYNSQTYKATSERVKTTPLKNIIQGTETLFTGDETQIKVSFLDDVLRDDYYRFNFDNGLYRGLEDKFINGQDYEFSFFYQDDQVALPETVTIKMSGITEDYFNYFRILLDQSGQTGGGPFQTVPATLLGNIVNQNDKENFALGYFIISDTSTFTLDLAEQQ